jgi:hypothetical protein
MGIHRIIRENFSFLQTSYGFLVTRQEPMETKYSSESTWINLSFAQRTSLCCTFGPVAGGGVFWREDLLYMQGEPRYRDAQEDQILESVVAVEGWLKFLSECWRACGTDILAGVPGAFQRLTDAREKRIREIDAADDLAHGDRR